MNPMEIITKCPQCFQLINNSNLRLVKELCGHIKCRNCILNDKEACSICLTIRLNQNEMEPVTVLLSPNTHCKVKTEWAKLASESLLKVQETSTQVFDDEDNTFSDKIDVQSDSENKINEKIKIIENIVISPVAATSTTINEKKRKKKIRLKDKKVCIPEHLENDLNKFSYFQKNTKILKQRFSLPSYISSKFIENEKIFECEICQRTFKSTTNIKYHLFCDKKQQKPYSCDICDKVTKLFIKNFVEIPIFQNPFFSKYHIYKWVLRQ